MVGVLSLFTGCNCSNYDWWLGDGVLCPHKVSASYKRSGRGEEKYMKKAFTMLELVFVLVVIGILAAVMIPEMKSNKTREEATQLITHIRYTQHLAMVDDKFDATAGSNWFRNRWQIRFSGTGNSFYSIVSDDNTRFAVNPLDKSNNLTNIELENQTVTLSDGCNGQTIISFDEMGRPIVGDLSDDDSPIMVNQLLNTTCKITITDGTESVEIDIEPETGYAHII